MRETKTKTFKNGEKEFNLLFTQLAPSKSLIFMMYMGKILGGSAGKVLGSFSGSANSIQELSKIKENDLNLEKLGDAIFGVFERLDDQEVIEKLNLLFSSVSIDGENLSVDHFMFQGDPMLIMKVAKESMGVNYGRFLDGNSGVLGKLIETIKSMKSIQKEPT